MSNELQKQHILEAIDKLRFRKSRPDLLRIVSYVSKKFEFPKNAIKDYLEALCVEGSVLKVEFKGSISYRNAANYRNQKPSTLDIGLRDDVISEQIGFILAQMVLQTPGFIDVGISSEELYSRIDFKDNKFAKQTFEQILAQEVASNNLVKFENGNYCLGYMSNQGAMFPSDMSDNSYESEDEIVDVSVTNSPPPSSANSAPKEPGLKPTKPVRTYSKAKPEKPAEKSIPIANTNNTSTGSSNEKPDKPRRPGRPSKAEKKEKDGEKDGELVSPKREGSRRKRIQKVVFDPSDLSQPKRSRDMGNKEGVKKLRGPYKKLTRDEMVSGVGVKKELSDLTKSGLDIKCDGLSDSESSDSASSEVLCKICQFCIEFKSNRLSERWVTCTLCTRKAHINCIEDSDYWAKLKTFKWQCNDCKPCVFCVNTKPSKESAIVICTLCGDGCHMKCANLQRPKFPEKWVCPKCSGVFSGIKEYDSAESVSNETSQQSTPEPDSKDLIKKEIDETIPDCTDWTCQQVYEYFLNYVGSEDAEIFRDQEIDGKVLLLLSRCDVLTDFKLKLGPALKVYAQIRKLQVRRSDQQLFWP